MRAIIHIGIPKTGSTYIQNTLAINRKILGLHGTLLPDDRLLLGGHDTPEYYYDQTVNHSWLVAACANEPDPQLLCWTGYKNISKHNLIRMARKIVSLTNPANIRLLSSEYLSPHLANEEEILRLRNEVLGDFSNVTILVWYRHPVPLAASAKRTIIKDGWRGVPSLEDIWIYLIDFRKLIKVWGSVFGYDNVVVRPFYENIISPHEIFRDFLVSSGLTHHSDFLYLKSTLTNYGIDVDSPTPVYFDKSYMNKRNTSCGELLSADEIKHLTDHNLLSGGELECYIPDLDQDRFFINQ